MRMSDADQPVASSGGAPKAAEPSAERSEAHNVRATATTGPQLVTIIKELLPEAVRGLNAGEASESAESPCPRPKSAGVAHVISVM